MPYTVQAEIDMLPPTVNHMYIARRGGGKALTDEAQTFRELVALALRAMATPPNAPLKLTVYLTFPNKRRSDGDNRLKACQDAIALALHFDDVQIREWHMYAAQGKHAGCKVLLEEQL